MKRIIVLVGIAALLLTSVRAEGQEKKIEKKIESNVTATIDEPDTELTFGDEKMKILSDEDVTVVRLGKRTINIYDTESGPNIKISKVAEQSEESLLREDEEHKRPSRHRFTPHWSGFEIGFNNYLGAEYSSTLPPAYNFMDLNTGKSMNININFAQLGFGITRHFGLVTGLGFEMNDYVFEGNNNIMKNDMGEIVEYNADLDGISLDKSKLSTTYFVVPVLFELQVPVKRGNTINLAAGAIGGAKIASHTKMVYHDDGRQKVKEKNDFSLNLLRYGPTVRVGYESFQLYATYYMNGLFKDGKGPELYPVQIGIAFTFD
jgi:hypothetical protein